MSIHEKIAREAAERDSRLDHDLTQLHKINDPGFKELRLQLKTSWDEYFAEYAFRLAHDRAFGPRIQPPAENTVSEITVRTSAENKWKHLAPLVVQAGYKPIRDIPDSDEESTHRRLRERSDFPDRYAIMVAASKQSLLDTYKTPILTLDTVTVVDGVPMDKPKDTKEALEMIMQMSGTRVSTETGLLLVIGVKSGRLVTLFNNIGLSYVMNKFDQNYIADYVATEKVITLSVPIGIDLSGVEARTRYVDMSQPITYTRKNHLAHEGQLTLDGHDLESPLFDPFFTGVPTHAIKALLPIVNDIYLHGDPYSVP